MEKLEKEKELELDREELLKEFQVEELEQRFEMATLIESGNPKEGQGWTIITIEF